MLTASGGALLAAALATGLMANARYASLEDDCPDRRCTSAQQGDLDSLGRLTLTTDILLGVGGAAAVSGLVWWIVGGDDGQDTRALRLDVGPRSLTVSGRF